MFVLGLLLFGGSMLALGALATMAYVGSLGWEQAHDEDWYREIDMLRAQRAEMLEMLNRGD